MIVFVGSNPSTASTTDEAFHESARSSKILADWTKDIPGDKRYVNVARRKTDNNKALTTAEMKAELPRLKNDLAGATRIVALGKTAMRALSLLGVDFYEMPHPSGRNRLLNDKEYAARKIKELVHYCNELRNN